ncbi:MAG: TM2 domain-containing protein [Firmicutes bacterium]|nr:TM2 domain-containing protein [Bacillota bacterium]
MSKKNYKQGSRVYVTVTSDHSRMVALLLCIFLGFIGIHHFYVGRIVKGILYLFTGGFLGIGWIIDLIQILCGTYKDGAGQPLVKW